MGKDADVLLAVKERDLAALHKLFGKSRLPKSKLIGTGRKPNVNFQDEDGMCALHQAALVGSTDIMRLLLENGAEVDRKDQKGMRPIHYAAWQGNIDPVGILLRASSSANEPSYEGMTPLHLACEHGHYEVVSLLLNHSGDPTLINHHYQTPLHLACEFGRYRVVELLIVSNRCNSLLISSPDDMADNNRTTCIHLAAKNGHTDIIRLLLQAGVDINRQTLQGTSLHEAALYGKLEVVKLLLDCGVDVNQTNNTGQTALDIVNQFTTSRAGRDLKHLLKEASYAIHARAVKEYYNMQEPNHISFREGDYIRVVEKHPSGMWKGYVISNEGQMTKAGYFPSNNVVLVDAQALANRPLTGYNSGPSNGDRSPYPSQQQVPDLIAKQHSCHNSTHSVNGNHIGPHGNPVGDYNNPSYTQITVGTDDTFPPPPSPLVSPQTPPYSKDRDIDRDSGISPQQSSQPFPSPQGFPRQHSPHSPAERTAEWIGRYVSVAGSDGRSGSPASSSRGSPSSSNRNSISSTNSGGCVSNHYVNSYHHHHSASQPQHAPGGIGGGGGGSGGPAASIHGNNGHRLSGQSYESGVSGVSSHQSYHSGSSSSLGSLDRLEDTGYSSAVNVHELFQQGLADHEVLRAWLTELHFEEYYTLFIHAGYDLPTISRMTPEDMTAIGITKPAHRKRLKAEIGKLHIHDGIPDFIPTDVCHWLRLLTLDEYYKTLDAQGYTQVEALTDITWEDLEEIGIKRLGHQKKMMLAIDRLKRILNGQFRAAGMDPQQQMSRHGQESLEPPSSFPTPKWLESPNQSPESPLPNGPIPGGDSNSHQSSRSARSPSLDNIMSRTPDQRIYQQGLVSSTREDIYSKPQIPGFPAHQAGMQDMPSSPAKARRTSSSATAGGQGQYQPDVVAIQVSNPISRKMSESSDSDSARTHFSFQSPARSRHSSGEATPTYDRGGLSGDETDGSGTLKRVTARASPVPKQKSLAQIMAGPRRLSQELSPADIAKFNSIQNTERQDTTGAHYGSLPRRDSLRKNKSTEHIYDSPAGVPQRVVHQADQSSHSPVIMNTGRGSAPSSPYHTSSTFFGGGPQGTPKSSKKAPPPPPKRTNSIKQAHSPLHTASQNGASSESKSTHMSSLQVSIPGGSQSPGQQSPNSNSQQAQHSPSSNCSSNRQSPNSQYSPQPMPLLNTASYTSGVKSLTDKFRHGGSKDKVTGGPPPPISAKPKVSSHQSQSGEYHTPTHISSHVGSQERLRDSSQKTKNGNHEVRRNGAKSNSYTENPLNDVIQQLELQVNSLGPSPQEQLHRSSHTSLETSPQQGTLISEQNRGIPPQHSGSNNITNHHQVINTIEFSEDNHHHQLQSSGIDSASNTLTKNSKDTRLGDWQDSHRDSGSDSDTGTLERKKHLPPPDTRTDTAASATAVDSSKNSQEAPMPTTNLERANSSGNIDSNTLPFANENVGTIKQRNQTPKPSIVSVSSGSEGEGERYVELNTSVFGDEGEEEGGQTGTIKRRSASGSNRSTSHTEAAGADSESRRTAPPPTPQRQDSLMRGAEGASAQQKQSGDVLNDIGNMLQDLTDELDAMLEFEIE